MQLLLELEFETILKNDLISCSAYLIERFGYTRYFRMKEYAFEQFNGNRLKLF